MTILPSRACRASLPVGAPLLDLRNAVPARRLFRSQGFTIIELLVSFVILAIILAILLSAISHLSKIWRQSSSRINAFQNGRRSFESMTHLIGQATLNTYFDYDNPNAPTRYLRKSELHFLIDQAPLLLTGENPVYGWAIFFQAPAKRFGQAGDRGLDGLLNACGFYIEYGSDVGWLPAHVNPANAKSRFRLMHWIQDAEDLRVYAGGGERDWMSAAGSATPLADNIIALVFWPHGSNAASNSAYAYDSRRNASSTPQPQPAHQLPRVLQVAMVAISEDSARRLNDRLKSTIEDCLEGLFIPSHSPSEYFQQDLSTLEKRLAKEKIDYRVFNSAIPLHESKWSGM